MDFATIAGLLIAAVAVLGGQALEGGSVGSILQPTAALIVIGGTMGAIAVHFPAGVLLKAVKEIPRVFRPEVVDSKAIVSLVVALATKARRDGLVAIEKEVEQIKDPFIRRGLEFAVDGTDAKAIRSSMELELDHFEEDESAAIKVLEAAGGYSPTIGILGAVLGLIHVMESLSDPAKLGGGIAVAFVATVYGVGLANLVFLPMSSKMKQRLREKIVGRELVIEGVVALSEGENPKIIERKLSVLVAEKTAAAPAKTPAKAAARTPESAAT